MIFLFRFHTCYSLVTLCHRFDHWVRYRAANCLTNFHRFFFVSFRFLPKSFLTSISMSVHVQFFLLQYLQMEVTTKMNQSNNNEMPGFAHLTNNKKFLSITWRPFFAASLGVCLLTCSFVVSITIFVTFFFRKLGRHKLSWLTGFILNWKN